MNKKQQLPLSCKPETKITVITQTWNADYSYHADRNKYRWHANLKTKITVIMQSWSKNYVIMQTWNKEYRYHHKLKRNLQLSARPKTKITVNIQN